MTTGITFSAFDLFHAGHVKMLEEAKRQCDYLIVGLQTDPNLTRKDFIADCVLARNPKKVGVYRLIMKTGPTISRFQRSRA